MSTWRMTREPGNGEAIRRLMVREGDKSLRRGAVHEPACWLRSESEERPSRVREVSEEEHGENRGQHDNRQGDEDGCFDRPWDGVLRRADLRPEALHLTDHAGVLVEGECAV